MKEILNNVLEITDGCTGCGVCEISCPKKCIKIKENEEGFYEPNIEEESCVNCGICQKSCYKFINEEADKEFSIYKAKGYLAYSLNEEDRKKSSSGGIGRAISKYGIENNMSIIGVEYDYKDDRAKHVEIDHLDNLDKITGSKYISSYTIDGFKNLDKNKQYIVFGTPCQIHALRKYMNSKKMNDLILIDFFCHGAPSMKLWDKYIAHIKQKHNIKNIKHINFRDKTTGWHNYSIKLKSDNSTYINKANKDVFFDFFLKKMCLPESCYTCKLRFNKIYSDIRLGDFWGPKCEHDELGTSIVLTNTELGEKIINSLKDIHIENISFEETRESQYIEKLNMPKQRKKVINDLKTDINMDQLYKRYIRNEKLKQRIKWKVKNTFSKVIDKGVHEKK